MYVYVVYVRMEVTKVSLRDFLYNHIAQSTIRTCFALRNFIKVLFLLDSLKKINLVRANILEIGLMQKKKKNKRNQNNIVTYC
jgi:hypothetical protein